MSQLVLFDYATLDQETRIVVQQRTSEIKTLVRKTAEDIVEIGHKLDEVRGRLLNGQFNGWLQQEFGMSRRTAYNFISVYERFGSANFAQLDISTSALYLLAAESTTDEARAEAVARAQAGERITPTVAQEIVAEHRPERYCPACGEAIEGEGRYCGGAHCKYQGTPRPDLREEAEREPDEWIDENALDDQADGGSIDEVEAEFEDDGEPSAQPSPAPVMKPVTPALVVSRPAPVMQPAAAPAPRPVPVMQPIEVAPDTAKREARSQKPVLLTVWIEPGDDPQRTIRLSIGREGEFPLMVKGRFCDLGHMVQEACAKFYVMESRQEVILAEEV